MIVAFKPVYQQLTQPCSLESSQTSRDESDHVTIRTTQDCKASIRKSRGWRCGSSLKCCPTASLQSMVPQRLLHPSRSPASWWSETALSPLAFGSSGSFDVFVLANESVMFFFFFLTSCSVQLDELLNDHWRLLSLAGHESILHWNTEVFLVAKRCPDYALVS